MEIELWLHTRILPEEQRVPGIIPFAEQPYRRVLDMPVKHFQHHDDLLGDTLSCNDILVGHTLTRLPVPIAPYPSLLACTKHPGMRDTFRRAGQQTPVKSGGAS